MPGIKQILIAVIFFLPVYGVHAQVPKNGKPVPVQKFKPPKVKTSWGNLADSASISVNEALELLSIPLKIIDAKKNEYVISSYQFLYRKLGIIEIDETGRTMPTTTISAQLFRTTPLSDIWIKSIREQLKAGEELYYYDIVAKDNQGHLFFAPTLSIRTN